MIYSHQALKYIPVYYIRVAQFHLGNLKEILIKMLHRLLINQGVHKHSTEQQKKYCLLTADTLLIPDFLKSHDKNHYL